MGGTTNSQALRFPFVDEVISDTAIKNLATDCATKLDAQDVTRAAVLKRPMATVTRNAVQNIAVNTDTTLIWDTIGFDPNSMVNLGTQPTRITVPSTATGLWHVEIHGNTNNTWSRTTLSFMVTGVVKAVKTFYFNDFLWYNFATMLVVPNANDYIECRVRHSGGGTDPMQFQTVTARLVSKT